MDDDKQSSSSDATGDAASGQDKQITAPSGRPGSDRRLFYILAVALAAITGFVATVIIAKSVRDLRQTDVRETQPERVAEGAGAKGWSRLVKASPPVAMGEVAFVDGEGKPRNLAEWKGKVVLLNLWATWCAPCRAEMPSLARLQAKMGGADFAVVAVSQDRGGAEAPRKFLTNNGISQLGLYLDASGKLIQTLKAPGLPLTVLIDREGRQMARLAGPAEWDSPEAEALIRAAMAEGARF